MLRIGGKQFAVDAGRGDDIARLVMGVGDGLAGDWIGSWGGSVQGSTWKTQRGAHHRGGIVGAAIVGAAMAAIF